MGGYDCRIQLCVLPMVACGALSGGLSTCNNSGMHLLRRHNGIAQSYGLPPLNAPEDALAPACGSLVRGSPMGAGHLVRGALSGWDLLPS